MPERYRRWSLMAAGLLLSMTVVPTSNAQIPVRKDRPVERDTLQVIQVRVDTVYVDKVLVRVDTLFLRDTVQVTTAVPMMPEGPQFYWGIGGGAAIPSQNLDTFYDPGFNASLLAGWRSQTSPFGVRLEGAYNQFAGGTVGGIAVDEASAWGAMADLTLDFPWNRDRTAGLYLLGGVGLHGFSGWDIDDEDFDELVNDNVVDETEIMRSSSTDFGVNAGAGLRFPVGRSSLFVEGRWVNVFTEGQDSRYFPITLGFTF